MSHSSYFNRLAMCKLCGTLCTRKGAPEMGRVYTDADYFPTINSDRFPTEAEDQLFSEDETEKKFVSDISWIKKDHWVHSEMRWNCIHGIRWERKDLIGEGSFGAVYVGMRTDKKLFAVKSIFMKYPLEEFDKYRMKKQITEIKMLRYLRSKYIVRFLGCGRSKGENGLDHAAALDVFMEFAPRGSLTDVYKARNRVPFEEDPYIRQYTYDLLKALQYMQKKRVVHGDIKCGNILLTDDCVKLTDWGGSKQLNATNLKKFLTGTMSYLAPEAILREKEQSYPSDIFSLGCTVIQMATGSGPKRVRAKVMGLDHLHSCIHSKDVQIPSYLSDLCKDFLKQCLYQNPEDRWTAAELLNHPFITDRNKTSTLPYSMHVPDEIRDKLLRPPRQLDPELPDEPVTPRVYKYLTGVNPGWVANLAGCSTLVLPPSPKPANILPADPLPPLSPGANNNEYPNNFIGWLQKKNPLYEEEGQSKCARYLSPQSSEHLIVPTPVGSPDRLPAASTSAIQEVCPTAADIVVSGSSRHLLRGMDRLALTEGLFTEIEPRETYEEMLNSVTVMREANKDIFKSAKNAPDSDLDRSIAQELFPQLKKLPSEPKSKGKMPKWDSPAAAPPEPKSKGKMLKGDSPAAAPPEPKSKGKVLKGDSPAAAPPEPKSKGKVLKGDSPAAAPPDPKSKGKMPKGDPAAAAPEPKLYTGKTREVTRTTPPKPKYMVERTLFEEAQHARAEELPDSSD